MSDLASKMTTAHIENLARDIINEEKLLDQYQKDFKDEFPEADKHLTQISEGLARVEDKKKELKEALAKANDYDIHTVEGKYFSISKVVRMKVKNIDDVPADFKAIMEVADEKRAANHYKLYGVAPDGFEDASYNKINWK